MAILSKLHDKCEKCKHKDKCDNKRMVACTMAEMPHPTMQNHTVPNTLPVMLPALRDTSIQAQIAEQLKKNLYENIFKINCDFNKS